MTLAQLLKKNELNQTIEALCTQAIACKYEGNFEAHDLLINEIIKLAQKEVK